MVSYFTLAIDMVKSFKFINTSISLKLKSFCIKFYFTGHKSLLKSKMRTPFDIGNVLLFYRNVLVESARIARGKIEKLSELDVSKHDAVIFPGGFGAAKNL